MKIFLSYAFTGEDKETVERRMRRIVDAFVKKGHTAYCNMFDEETKVFLTPREFVFDAVKKLRDYDTVIVINTSERRSEGVLIEVGAALALDKRIVVAQHKSSVNTTYLPELSETTFIWEDEDELVDKLLSIEGL